MSKSFEDNLRDKLSGYEAPPPASSKAFIFGKAAQPDKFLSVFHFCGGAFILLAMLVMGANDQLISDFSNERHSSELSKTEDTNENSIEISESVSLICLNDREEENVASDLACSSDIDPLTSEQTMGHMKKSGVESISFSQRYDYDTLAIFRMKMDSVVAFGNTEIELFEPVKVLPKEKPEHSAFAKLYLESGAFFVYNRLKPNLNDEIFVDHYDSPFGLSVSRIGFSLGAGIQRDWSPLYSTRFGLVASNYNQHYSFSLRSTTPDNVAISNGFAEPVFEESHYQIKQRVTTVGLKIQNTFSLPSAFNSLYFSLEYHRLLGTGPQFSYQGETYRLSAPDQWMVDVGLRKVLAEFQNSYLFIIPGLKYTLNGTNYDKIMDVRPFSAGLTVSYSLK